MSLTLQHLAAEECRPEPGKFVSYQVNDVNPDMSMLECSTF